MVQWLRYVMILAASVIAGCAAPMVREVEETTPKLPPSVMVEPALSPAYFRLLDEGEALLESEDITGAIALFERAQRIHADDARVYLAIARAYAVAGDERSAMAMAERGLLYCKSAEKCRELDQFVR